MRRAIHTAIAATAVLLLLRPLDCFGMNLEALDCCIRGSCLPTATSDDCCKGVVLPYGSQLFEQTHTNAALHSLVDLFDVVPTADASTPTQFRGEPSLRIHAPPGSPPGFRLNLPLLI